MTRNSTASINPQNNPFVSNVIGRNVGAGAPGAGFGRSRVTTPIQQRVSNPGSLPDPTLLAADVFGVNVNDSGGGGGGGSGGSRFSSLPFTLKDLALQRELLQHQQSSGLRDIETARGLGTEAARNNALQRGIFDSGIRTRNVGRVNTRADEQGGDLREQIRIALARLTNQEGLAKASDAHAASNFGRGGGGGGGGSFSRDQIQGVFSNILNQATQGNLAPSLASRVMGIELIRARSNPVAVGDLDQSQRSFLNNMAGLASLGPGYRGGVA